MATPSLLLIPDRYKKDKLYSQIPDSGAGDLTFARNSNATRVNSAGLIEKVRTNIALYSEDLTNAYWTKFDSAISGNSITNPLNGSLTADTITPSTDNNVHRIRPTLPGLSAGQTYTISFYAKANGYNFVRIIENTTTGDVKQFNLSNGTIDLGGLNGQIVSLGNGWYRCSAQIVVAASQTIDIQVQETSATESFAGNGTSGIYFFGAQLEVSDFGATPYIPTTTAAVSVGPVADIPRIDYTGGGCGKLLLEPQRTNLITFSEQFDNAAWTKFGSSASANQAVSPDGFTNGDKLLPDNGIDIAVPAAGIFTAGASAYLRSGALTLTAASYTFSIFVKKAELDHVQLRSATNIDLTSDGSGNIVNLNNGTPAVANTVQDYGNGWYRVSHTFTATAATWYVGLWFWNTTSLTANGSQGFFSYGAQLEAGSYPTSYIPTLGSSVTCLADAASKTGISSLIGQSEGVLYAEAKTLSQGITEKIISISDGTAANVIYFSYSAGAGNQIFYVIVAGGVLQSALSVAVSQIVTNKIAIKYKANDCSFWLNGTKIHQVNSANMPTGLSVIQTTYPTVPYDFEGDINAIALYLNALTDAELATLTAL